MHKEEIFVCCVVGFVLMILAGLVSLIGITEYNRGYTKQQIIKEELGKDVSWLTASNYPITYIVGDKVNLIDGSK
jgi:hypothetical protein